MGTGTQLTSNEHLLQELEAISAVGIALSSGRTDAELTRMLSTKEGRLRRATSSTPW